MGRWKGGDKKGAARSKLPKEARLVIRTKLRLRSRDESVGVGWGGWRKERGEVRLAVKDSFQRDRKQLLRAFKSELLASPLEILTTRY